MRAIKKIKRSKKAILDAIAALFVIFILFLAFFLFRGCVAEKAYQQNLLEVKNIEKFDVNYRVLMALRSPVETDKRLAENIGELFVMSFDENGKLVTREDTLSGLPSPQPDGPSEGLEPADQDILSEENFIMQIQTVSIMPENIIDYRFVIAEALDEFKVVIMPENKETPFSFVENKKSTQSPKSHIILPYPSGPETRYLKLIALDTQAIIPEVGES